MINHLWQSTVFAGFIALVALAMRGRAARVRHALWLAASVKFLVPFAILVSFGSHLGIPIAAAPAGESFSGLSWFGLEFLPTASPAAAIPRTPARSSAPLLLIVVWVAGALVILRSWLREWWRIRRIVRAAVPMRRTLPIPAVLSGAASEPGIFGIFRPVLVLPQGIEERLSHAELDAVIAHELCHARHRDNLSAAVHMLVEALFWFHPLVWWMERKLIEERERACDEFVLVHGNDPHTYAESILKVCESYRTSPMMCMAGVGGANLKQRIENICTAIPVRPLDFARKLLLAAAGCAALLAPVAVGVLNGPRLRAQSAQPKNLPPPAFEVATIKPAQTEIRRMGAQFFPGGRLSVQGLPLRMLIAIAYDIPFQSARLTGGPDWAAGDRFDIEAKADPAAVPAGLSVRERQTRTRRMLQTLLADRFKLTLRRETKEVPVYVVLVGKGGPKLEPSKIAEKDCPEDPADAREGCHMFNGGMGRGLHGTAVDMADLALAISNWSDKPAIDRTGISGLYNIQTDGWTPMTPRQPGVDSSPEAEAMADPTRPTLHMILGKLGLRLESQKAPLEMFVIEHAEKPVAN